MDLKKLGTIIHDKREAMGIPPSTLAEKVGVSRPTLWVWERGENPKTGKPSRPSKYALERLTEVLHMNQVETEELLSLAGYDVIKQISPTSNHMPTSLQTSAIQQLTQSPPTIITEINGTVYYAHDGYLEAFNAKTGNHLWSSPIGISPLEPVQASAIEHDQQAELSTQSYTVDLDTLMQEYIQKAVVAAISELRVIVNAETEESIARSNTVASEPQVSEVAIEDLPAPEYSELKVANRRRRRSRTDGTNPTTTTPNEKTSAVTQSVAPSQPGSEVQTPVVSCSPVIFDIPDEMRRRVNYVLEKNFPAIFLGQDFTIQAANLLAFWLFDTTDPCNPAFDKTSLLGRKVSEVCNRKDFVKRILPSREGTYSVSRQIEVLKTLEAERDPAALAAFKYLLHNIPGLQVEEPEGDGNWPCILTINPPSELENGPEFFKFDISVTPIFRDFSQTICDEYIVVFELKYLLFEEHEEYRKAGNFIWQEHNRLKNLPDLSYIQWQDQQPFQVKHTVEEKPEGLLFALSGIGCSENKDVLKKLRGQENDIHISKRFTTRSRRMGEVQGNPYFFLPKKEFEAYKDAHKLLTYGLHPDRPDWYGHLAEPIMEQLCAGQNVIMEASPEEAVMLRRVKPDTIFILLNLIDSRDSIQTAAAEDQRWKKRFQGFVFNHTITYDRSLVPEAANEAAQALHAIILAEREEAREKQEAEDESAIQKHHRKSSRHNKPPSNED